MRHVIRQQIIAVQASVFVTRDVAQKSDGGHEAVVACAVELEVGHVLQVV